MGSAVRVVQSRCPGSPDTYHCPRFQWPQYYGFYVPSHICYVLVGHCFPVTSFDSFKSITFRERGILAFCVCIAAGVEPVGLHTCQMSLLPLSKTSCCLGDFRQEFGRMSIYIYLLWIALALFCLLLLIHFPGEGLPGTRPCDPSNE